MKLLSPLLLGCSCALLSAQVPHPQAALKGEAYIAEMKQRLAIAKRDRDPFGLRQDLTAPSLKEELEADQRSTLKEALKSLEFSGIDPHRGFLWGAREFHAGQVFSIVFDGQIFRVRVAGIGASTVTLQDNTTGDKVVLELELPSDSLLEHEAPLLPKGMERDSTDAPVYLR